MRSWHIALNIIKRTLGTRKGFITSIIIPVAVISVITSLFGTQSWGVSTSVTYANLDQGIIGEHLISELKTLGTYDLQQVQSEEDSKNVVLKNNSSVSFVIPANYTEQMMARAPLPVRIFQMSETEVTATLKLNLEQQTASLDNMIQLLINTGYEGDDLQENLIRFLNEKGHNPIGVVKSSLQQSSSSSLFLVIGFILMFLMTSISRSVSMLLEDRRQHTLERIFSAPVRRWEIALGNFLGSFFMGTLLVLGFSSFTMYVIHFDYGIDFIPLFIVLECFMLAALGLASLTASFVRNSNNLGSINTLIVTPTCMIGGCYWPLEFMPKAMQKLAFFTPQYWAIDAANKLSIGNTLANISGQLGVLLLFACVLLAFGSVILAPSAAVQD
ncbi:MAG: ABC transporter permease [Gorillibacterium sp.]|nr:ABC transporter permease [Gorillibacterium sp.]